MKHKKLSYIDTKVDEGATLPRRAKPADAGADLATPANFAVEPGQRALIKTGVRIDIPEGYAGLICGRSGLAANHGIDVLGGVIDAGYRGEIGVVLVNTGRRRVTFKKGDRIAQLLITPVVTPMFVTTTKFEGETERGEDGFGSTGLTKTGVAITGAD